MGVTGLTAVKGFVRQAPNVNGSTETRNPGLSPQHTAGDLHFVSLFPKGLGELW